MVRYHDDNFAIFFLFPELSEQLLKVLFLSITLSGGSKCYMMAYNAFDKNGDALTYKAVERFVKETKSHRNIADQDKGEVERLWKESAL